MVGVNSEMAQRRTTNRRPPSRRAPRRRRRRGSAICVVTILIAVGLFWIHSEHPDLFPNLIGTITETTTPTAGDMTEAVVTRVIDGDTVELSSGERVRFIGIDAPEIGEPGADEATNFVRERTEGRTVWLEADGNNTDRHGRLRRYIWLQMPTDPTDETQIRAYMLNALMLEYGLAEVMIVGNVRNEALFRQISTR